jgi:general secretion pathway protein C
MLTPTSATWTVRGATFALWALAAASAMYWGLKLGATSRPVNAPVPAPRQVAAADPAAIARLLGSTPTAAAASMAAPSLASRFQLVGVAAGERSGGGAAVIAVDGKPARPYKVGAMIEEGLLLQAVRGRTATLAAETTGQPVLVLELPPVALLPPRPPQAAIAAPR